MLGGSIIQFDSKFICIPKRLQNNTVPLEMMGLWQISIPPHNKNKRLKVFKTKGFVCKHCGREGRFLIRNIDPGGNEHIDLYTEDFVLMTVDHIIPSSKGGSNGMHNKQPLCYKCNQKKGNKIINYEKILINMGDVATPETVKEKKGLFAQQLLRNNKDIRDDRALAILRKAEQGYRRKVDDLKDEINDLKIERNNALDLSPTTADSLKLVDNFNGVEFTEKDIRIGRRIKDKEIDLAIAEARYAELFT